MPLLGLKSPEWGSLLQHLEIHHSAALLLREYGTTVYGFSFLQHFTGIRAAMPRWRASVATVTLSLGMAAIGLVQGPLKGRASVRAGLLVRL